MTKKSNKQNQICKPQNNVVKDIVNIIDSARNNALRAVNAQLVNMYWLIGKRIDEELLTNKSNDYGKQLIKKLSMELSKFGKGLGESNLRRFHNFYLKFKNLFEYDSKQKIWATLRPESLLPWSFYKLLLPILNNNERNWYANESKQYGWSSRQLERNIKTDYYHRVLSNQLENKTNKPTTINQNDYLKPLYIFDFLNFKKNQKYKESDLEKSLLSHLKDFILELGKGYSFTSRQFHLRDNNQDYYIDLVFYNSILKCSVLIDLKVGKIQNKDIGQMLIYLDLFDKQYKQSNDNPTIGIILSSDSNEVIVRYLSQHTNNHIVPSKYLTYLPSKEELTKEINNISNQLNKKEILND